MPQLFQQQFIPASPAAVWEFFATPKNLNELTPPDLRFEIRSELPPHMYQGQLIEYRIFADAGRGFPLPHGKPALGRGRLLRG